MQARYVIGAGIMLGAFAVVAIVAYFANQELYMTVDELARDTSLMAAAAEPDGRSAEIGDGAASAGAAAAVSAPNAGEGSGQGAGVVSSGRRLQVRGVVDYDTVQRPAEGLELRFDLTGEESRLPVVYEGMVPDTFDMAEQVTVAGHLGPDGTFVADDLVVQCPSKYEAEPPGAAGDDATGGQGGAQTEGEPEGALPGDAGVSGQSASGQAAGGSSADG